MIEEKYLKVIFCHMEDCLYFPCCGHYLINPDEEDDNGCPDYRREVSDD